jgi:hypothetical protein
MLFRMMSIPHPPGAIIPLADKDNNGQIVSLAGEIDKIEKCRGRALRQAGGHLPPVSMSGCRPSPGRLFGGPKASDDLEHGRLGRSLRAIAARLFA